MHIGVDKQTIWKKIGQFIFGERKLKNSLDNCINSVVMNNIKHTMAILLHVSFMNYYNSIPYIINARRNLYFSFSYLNKWMKMWVLFTVLLHT